LKPTRRTQPYRKGARLPGPVLDMILKGSATNQPNPIEPTRQLSRLIARMRKRRA